MGNLRDQLLKAKLINPKELQQADRAAREQRRDNLRKGKDERLLESEDKQTDRLAQQREEDRKRELERQAAKGEHDQQQMAYNLMTAGKIASRGNRRFFFVASSGKIPFLDVSDEVGKQLERGQAAIVESSQRLTPEFYVVKQQTALKIRELAPESVRFLNQAGE